MARPSGSIGLIWGFASVLDRAKANSAILRCRTRVVPLRTVNESLNGDAMREARFFHLAPKWQCLDLVITLRQPCFVYDAVTDRCVDCL